ncbi:hypothetical protein L1987_06536 [Smallanthus sonchifolius]|uniref:Uncharacterized protein n=1 Tax=Smallanthus sonchifolius TaxID=185202 RepID=A0ACB9JYD1_9ASTR|nr:hypothetical protein L1987_06536 [Smallanthus sonchifolius]
MTEPPEELEPLFDYTRVQPFDVVCLEDDDDDDCSSLIPSKRRKPSASAVDKVQVISEAVVIDDGVDDDDLDWLESPPKVPVNKEKRCENSIIKELRLKRKELLSVTESTKEMVRTVEECVKRDLKTLSNSDCESPIEKPPKPAVERPKIVISIQDKDGLKQFRIYMDDKFERLFKMYADKVKNKVENLVFCFDGDKIDPSTTPGSLEMEDDDMIEVHVKST